MHAKLQSPNIHMMPQHRNTIHVHRTTQEEGQDHAANVKHSCRFDLFFSVLPWPPKGKGQWPNLLYAYALWSKKTASCLCTDMFPRCREKVLWLSLHHHDVTACVLSQDHVARCTIGVYSSMHCRHGDGACLFVLHFSGLHVLQILRQSTFLQKNCVCVHITN